MKYQEKKFRVDSFARIQKILHDTGAKKEPEIVTTHYYTEQESNDVVKLVAYSNRNEIHILGESQGTYALKKNIPVENTDIGLRWLKDKGYGVVQIVKMADTDYEYKNGIVGLYIIDDFLYSVILDFPEGHHEEIEKEFGLNTAEVIAVPYNKYLEKLGRLRILELN